MFPIAFPLSAAEPRIYVKDITLAAVDNQPGNGNIDLPTDYAFLMLEWSLASSLETLTEELHKKCSGRWRITKPNNYIFFDDYVPSRFVNDARRSGANDGPFLILPAGATLVLEVENNGGANASTVTGIFKGLALKDRGFWAQHGITW